MAGSRAGTLAIFVAKLVFLVSGYVGIAVLSRLLTREEFGAYSVVMGVAALINMILINGTLQTVSRFVAAHPEQAGAVRRRAFAYQALFVSVVAGGMLLSADGVAALLNDASLAPLVRLAMVITVVYAFYAINVGYLNGKKRFVAQASLDIFFSVVKWTLMATFAFLGWKVAGVIGGFASAAVAVFLLSFILAGGDFRGPSADITIKRFATFAFSVMGVALLLNALLQTDLFVLKRLSPTDIADTQAGLYGAAQQIARIPYYLMVTASLVLFPTIAALTNDAASSRQRADTVSQAWTGLFVLVAGMAAVTVPLADRVLLVLYPAEYVEAGPTLAVLIVALVLMTMVNISVTIVSGGGMPHASVVLLASALIIQLAVAHGLVPAMGSRGAALSTAIAGGLCLASLTWFMRRRFGLRVAPAVVVGLVVSCAVVVGLSFGFAQLVPDVGGLLGKLITVAWCAVAFAIYLGLALLFGVLVGVRAHTDRVLLVTKPLAAPWNDGSKTALRAMLHHLPREQYAVLSTRQGKRELAEAFPDLEVITAYGGGATFGGRLAENARVFLTLLALRHNFRALHFFFAPNPAASAAARLLRLLTPSRVPFMQTVMSRPRTFEGVKGLLFGDKVIASSDDTAERLAAASGRDVEVSRPGVDDVPGLDDEQRLAACVREGLAADRVHILFAGDLDEGGADPHLRAVLPALLEARDDVDVHISVRSKSERTVEMALALATSLEADHPGRVHRHVDHEHFNDLLDASDAMVLPQEDLIAKVDAPLVALETLARGKPVFMLNRPPLDEIPPAELRAQLLAEDDSALVQKLLSWLDDRGTIPPEALVAHIHDRFSAAAAAATIRRLHDGAQ